MDYLFDSGSRWDVLGVVMQGGVVAKVGRVGVEAWVEGRGGAQADEAHGQDNQRLKNIMYTNQTVQY